MMLDEMSLDELRDLLSRAEQQLTRRRREQDSSLQRDLARAASAAGLTPEEWRFLVGD